MSDRFHRFAGSCALAAAIAMAGTPAHAMPLPHPGTASSVAPANPGAESGNEVGYDRRWYGRRHRHGGIDAGDVIVGVLIIGGIAAIASAASKPKRDREDDYRDYRDRPYDYRDRHDDYRGDRPDYDGHRGLERAVAMCVREIERDERVDTVEGVDRTSAGWRVDGILRNGSTFSCEIGNDGRIRDIDLDAGIASASDGQWDDESYARAREVRDPAFDDGV